MASIAVDDRLTVLEPDVEIALAAAGVTDPSVTMDDTAATIAGSVLDTATRDAAIAAARAVPGITTINDELTIADSDADVDTDAGDTDAGGTDADRDDAGSADAGDGDTTAPDSDADAGTPTEAELQARVDDAIVGLGAAAGDAVGDVDSGQVTLTGTVASDDDREAVVAAVDAIDGVDGVIDRLVVVDDVARVDEINEVLEANPIRFRSSESEILPESFPTLDRVVEVLQGPPLAVRIEGYTDVLGDQDFNLALSQARADAVLVYLTDSGVDTSQMEAVGLGETERFGAGNTVEALAANRRVLFQLP
jgi:OOP family OmpA-OmpF porin